MPTPNPNSMPKKRAPLTARPVEDSAPRQRSSLDSSLGVLNRYYLFGRAPQQGTKRLEFAGMALRLFDLLSERVAQMDMGVRLTPLKRVGRSLATLLDLQHLTGDVPGADALAAIPPEKLNNMLWHARPLSARDELEVYPRPDMTVLPYPTSKPDMRFVGVKVQSPVLENESAIAVDTLQRLMGSDTAIDVQPKKTFYLPFAEVQGAVADLENFRVNAIEQGERFPSRYLPRVVHLFAVVSDNLEIRTQAPASPLTPDA